MSNIHYMGYSYEDHIDLRKLRYFIAVAEELHFGRAADRLGMAQPPLTQQIQKLETALGCKLFSRKPRKTSLTEAGTVLLEEARRLLAGVDQAIERTRRAGRGETGHLKVGVPPSVMLSALPLVIRTYRKRFPEVQFTLRELSTSAIAQELTSGSLDVGFLREMQASGPIAAEFSYREALVAVLPASHTLAARPKLTLRHLAGEPFILFPSRVGEAFYNQLTSLCVAAGFTPRVVQEATQWQSVVTFVETGMGVSIAPECVTRFRWKDVVYRPLPGLSTVVTACCRAGEKSAPARAFLRLAAEKMAVVGI
jgi:DNA-binding transcriptional LysR family regulator